MLMSDYMKISWYNYSLDFFISISLKNLKSIL